jgi:hypothetical protein
VINADKALLKGYSSDEGREEVEIWRRNIFWK